LVVTAGSPRAVRGARAPRGTPFPERARRRLPVGDLACVAQLEASRFRGYRHLVLPEGSREWFRRQTGFHDHVTHTYQAVVDEPGAGAVIDLTRQRESGSASLRAEVVRLTAGRDDIPAVLDWTTAGVAGELAGLSTFRPPAGDRLPYLDQTVDIVVVDDDRRVDEAQRVASSAVVSVSPGRQGPDVLDVRHIGAPIDRVVPRVLVWCNASESDETWRALLSQRAATAGAEVRVADVNAERAAGEDDHDVVVFVEPYVLPLPGAVEEAASIAAAHPTLAVTGKIVRSDGRLEAAGGAVFSDRSVALIAEGSAELTAPWHEYVRPVCWAPGLLAVSAAALRGTRVAAGLTGRGFTREWCAAFWEAGGSVMYHPTVTAVRVAGDGGEPTLPTCGRCGRTSSTTRPGDRCLPATTSRRAADDQRSRARRPHAVAGVRP
jgi:hypothetical protein